jgi:hypothetical protein
MLQQSLASQQPGKIFARSRKILVKRHCHAPSLSGALPITLGLIRIDLAHFFQEILRVRPRNVG